MDWQSLVFLLLDSFTLHSFHLLLFSPLILTLCAGFPVLIKNHKYYKSFFCRTKRGLVAVQQNQNFVIMDRLYWSSKELVLGVVMRVVAFSCGFG